MAARAEERAVSGLVAPGIATTPGASSRSHASATSRRRHAARFRDGRQCLLASERPRATWPAERRVRDQRDAGLGAPLDDSAPERAIVEHAQRDLDRRDRRELERLVELAAVHVRHADPLHEPLVDEASERA